MRKRVKERIKNREKEKEKEMFFILSFTRFLTNLPSLTVFRFFNFPLHTFFFEFPSESEFQVEQISKLNALAETKLHRNTMNQMRYVRYSSLNRIKFISVCKYYFIKFETVTLFPKTILSLLKYFFYIIKYNEI